MKKAIVMMCILITVMLASCGYSKEDVERARNEGYQTGYENGYSDAEYYAKAEIEKATREMCTRCL